MEWWEEWSGGRSGGGSGGGRSGVVGGMEWWEEWRGGRTESRHHGDTQHMDKLSSSCQTAPLTRHSQIKLTSEFGVLLFVAHQGRLTVTECNETLPMTDSAQFSTTKLPDQTFG